MTIFKILAYGFRVDFINKELDLLDENNPLDSKQIDLYLEELHEIETILEKSIEENKKQQEQERLSKFKVIDGGFNG